MSMKQRQAVRGETLKGISLGASPVSSPRVSQSTVPPRNHANMTPCVRSPRTSPLGGSTSRLDGALQRPHDHAHRISASSDLMVSRVRLGGTEAPGMPEQALGTEPASPHEPRATSAMAAAATTPDGHGFIKQTREQVEQLSALMQLLKDDVDSIRRENLELRTATNQRAKLSLSVSGSGRSPTKEAHLAGIPERDHLPRAGLPCCRADELVQSCSESAFSSARSSCRETWGGQHEQLEPNITGVRVDLEPTAAARPGRLMQAALDEQLAEANKGEKWNPKGHFNDRETISHAKQGDNVITPTWAVQSFSDHLSGVDTPVSSRGSGFFSARLSRMSLPQSRLDEDDGEVQKLKTQLADIERRNRDLEAASARKQQEQAAAQKAQEAMEMQRVAAAAQLEKQLANDQAKRVVMMEAVVVPVSIEEKIAEVERLRDQLACVERRNKDIQTAAETAAASEQRERMAALKAREVAQEAVAAVHHQEQLAEKLVTEVAAGAAMVAAKIAEQAAARGEESQSAWAGEKSHESAGPVAWAESFSGPFPRVDGPTSASTSPGSTSTPGGSDFHASPTVPKQEHGGAASIFVEDAEKPESVNSLSVSQSRGCSASLPSASDGEPTEKRLPSATAPMLVVVDSSEPEEELHLRSITRNDHWRKLRLTVEAGAAFNGILQTVREHQAFQLYDRDWNRPGFGGSNRLAGERLPSQALGASSQELSNTASKTLAAVEVESHEPIRACSQQDLASLPGPQSGSQKPAATKRPPAQGKKLPPQSRQSLASLSKKAGLAGTVSQPRLRRAPSKAAVLGKRSLSGASRQSLASSLLEGVASPAPASQLDENAPVDGVLLTTSASAKRCTSATLSNSACSSLSLSSNLDIPVPVESESKDFCPSSQASSRVCLETVCPDKVETTQIEQTTHTASHTHSHTDSHTHSKTNSHTKHSKHSWTHSPSEKHSLLGNGRRGSVRSAILQRSGSKLPTQAGAQRQKSSSEADTAIPTGSTFEGPASQRQHKDNSKVALGRSETSLALEKVETAEVAETSHSESHTHLHTNSHSHSHSHTHSQSHTHAHSHSNSHSQSHTH